MKNKLPLVAIFTTLIILSLSSGGFAWFWDGDIPNVDFPAGVTDQEMTDLIFEELVRNQISIGYGTAIYIVNNSFPQKIPVTTNYVIVKGGIKSNSETYAMKVETKYNESVPITSTVQNCTTEANGTWCWNDTIITGYNTVERTKIEWQPLQKAGPFHLIPGNFYGEIKFTAEFKNPAYNNPVQIDWIPKTVMDKGFFDVGGTEFAQTKWAWWNGNWLSRRKITVTCQDSPGCTNEPINITTNSTTIRLSAGYPGALRIIASNNITEIPYTFTNMSGNWTEGAEFLANSTTAGATYWLYYNNSVAPDVTYSDCTTWSPCWVDNVSKSFWIMRENFENKTLDHWNSPIGITARINTSDAPNGNAALWLNATSADSGFSFTYSDANTSHIWFGHRTIHFLTNSRTLTYIYDGVSTTGLTLRYNWNENKAEYFNTSYNTLATGDTYNWGVLVGDMSTNKINLTHNDNTTGNYFQHYSLNVRGSPAAFDTLSIGSQSGTPSISLFDDIYISPNNNFTLYNNMSAVTVGAEQTSPPSGPAINATLFSPVTNTEYTGGAIWEMWAEVCNTSSERAHEVNLTWDGTNTLVVANRTINVSCINVSVNHTDLAAGSYAWRWDVFGNDSNTDTASGTFTVAQNDSNVITITTTPSNDVDVGTQTTTTCTDTISATLTLDREGIIVSNPYTATLGIGTYVFNCTSSSSANYTAKWTTDTLLVESGGVGCSNNLTYAFVFNLTVTDNVTTVIDLWTQRNASQLRPDLQDTYVTGENATIIEINASRFLVLNTTGLVTKSIAIYWGNFLNNMSHTENQASIATATDTVSGVTESNNYIDITIIDEKNLTEAKPPNTNITIDLWCDGGAATYEVLNSSNLTQFIFATYNQWEQLRATVAYSPTDKYFRNLLFTSPIEDRNLYLVDAEKFQVAEVVNHLVDLTAKFKLGITTITVRKWVGDTLHTIDQQYFDASSRAYLYGIVGDKYEYYISNGDEQRILGFVIVDLSDLTKDLTLANVVDLDAAEYISELYFGIQYDNTTGIVTLYYEDTYNATSEINLSIYNMSDTLIYFAQAINTTNDTGIVIFQYMVPNASATYKLVVDVDHEQYIGAITFSTLFGASGIAIITTVISQLFLTLASLATIFSVTFSLTYANAAFGFMVGGILALMFFSLGWLSIPASAVAIMIFLAIFWYIGKGTGQK